MSETVVEGLERLDREVNDRAISNAIIRIQQLEAENERLRKLVSSVHCSPVYGPVLDEVDGENWFDAREALEAPSNPPDSVPDP